VPELCNSTGPERLRLGPEVAALLDAVSKLGALGLAVIMVALFIRGILRSGPLVDAEKQETKEERDEWKALAQGFTPELKRLNDLLATAVNLLLDPRRSEAEIERIIREVKAALGQD